MFALFYGDVIHYDEFIIAFLFLFIMLEAEGQWVSTWFPTVGGFFFYFHNVPVCFPCGTALWRDKSCTFFDATWLCRHSFLKLTITKFQTFQTFWISRVLRFIYFKISKSSKFQDFEISEFWKFNKFNARPFRNFHFADSHIYTKQYFYKLSPYVRLFFKVFLYYIRGLRVDVWSHFWEFQQK